MQNNKLPRSRQARLFSLQLRRTRTRINTAVLSLFLSFSLGYSLESQAETAHSTTASVESNKVYIISPKDGDTVPTTFTIQFGLTGMGVAPAGTDKDNTGHHHLLVDGETLPNMQAPMGKEVKHFGAGQTETEITLTPGKHTLQLILGDKNHQPHRSPLVSPQITVMVK